jgi:hypothetical protein
MESQANWVDSILAPRLVAAPRIIIAQLGQLGNQSNSETA